jgi:hypothetical protein
MLKRHILWSMKKKKIPKEVHYCISVLKFQRGVSRTQHPERIKVWERSYKQCYHTVRICLRTFAVAKFYIHPCDMLPYVYLCIHNKYVVRGDNYIYKLNKHATYTDSLYTPGLE